MLVTLERSTEPIVLSIFPLVYYSLTIARMHKLPMNAHINSYTVVDIIIVNHASSLDLPTRMPRLSWLYRYPLLFSMVILCKIVAKRHTNCNIIFDCCFLLMSSLT